MTAKVIFAMSTVALILISCAWAREDDQSKGAESTKEKKTATTPKVDVRVTAKEKAYLDMSRAVEEYKTHLPASDSLRDKFAAMQMFGGDGLPDVTGSGASNPLLNAKLEIQKDSLDDIETRMAALNETLKNATNDQKLKAGELSIQLTALKREFDEKQGLIVSLQEELKAANENAKKESIRARSQSVGLSIGVLVFSAVVIGILSYLVFKHNLADLLFFKLIGLTMVVASALFVIVAGFDQQQIAPMFGLLGAVAGYLFGKNETGAIPTPAGAQAVAGPHHV